MHIDTTFPPPGDRVGAVLAVANYLDSAELGAAIDALIARLDAVASDPDLEDDDPAGGDIVDVEHDAEEDFGCEEKGEGGSWPEQIEQHGEAGHHYADDGQEEDDWRAREPHRDRIRQTRCDIVHIGSKEHGRSEYYLREGSRRGGVTFGAV